MSTAHTVRSALKSLRALRATYDGRKGHNKKAASRAARRLGRALARDFG